MNYNLLSADGLHLSPAGVSQLENDFGAALEIMSRRSDDALAGTHSGSAEPPSSLSIFVHIQKKTYATVCGSGGNGSKGYSISHSNSNGSLRNPHKNHQMIQHPKIKCRHITCIKISTPVRGTSALGRENRKPKVSRTASPPQTHQVQWPMSLRLYNRFSILRDFDSHDYTLPNKTEANKKLTPVVTNVEFSGRSCTGQVSIDGDIKIIDTIDSKYIVKNRKHPQKQGRWHEISDQKRSRDAVTEKTYSNNSVS